MCITSAAAPPVVMRPTSLLQSALLPPVKVLVLENIPPSRLISHGARSGISGGSDAGSNGVATLSDGVLGVTDAMVASVATLSAGYTAAACSSAPTAVFPLSSALTCCPSIAGAVFPLFAIPSAGSVPAATPLVITSTALLFGPSMVRSSPCFVPFSLTTAVLVIVEPIEVRSSGPSMDEPRVAPAIEAVGRSPPFAALVPASREALADVGCNSGTVLFVLLAGAVVALAA